MLTRKPKVGEIIKFRIFDKDVKCKVIGFEGRICKIVYVDGKSKGEEDRFIWKFDSGYNKRATIIKSSGRSEENV